MANPPCLMCGKSPATKCATCKSAFYCSKACQTEDWTLHKTLCKAFAALPPRPKANAKLAILLPPDSPSPKFVWVPCPKAPLPHTTMKQDNLHLVPFLINRKEADVQHLETFYIHRNDVREYEIDHTVIVYARDNWFNDGSKPNQAAIAVTKPELPYDWRGPILIMSYDSLKTHNEPVIRQLGPLRTALLPPTIDKDKDYMDVTLGDYRAAIDHLSRYGKNFEPGTANFTIKAEQIGADGTKSMKVIKSLPKVDEMAKEPVKGVIIRCQGDMSLYGIGNKYVSTDIPKDHPIWSDQPTQMSKTMGLPLLVRRLPPDAAWKDKRNDPTRFDNQAATYLNLDIGLDSPHWGFAPPQWQSQVGSVLVVRHDQENISREQAYALAEFFQFHVSESWEDAMNSGNKRKREDVIARLLNWKRFENYLENFREEMMQADGRNEKAWRDVKSPFGTKQGPTGQDLRSGMCY